MNGTTCNFFVFYPGQRDASIPVKVAYLILSQTATHCTQLKGENILCFFFFFILYISILLNAVLALCSLYSSDRALVCKCYFFSEGLGFL